MNLGQFSLIFIFIIGNYSFPLNRRLTKKKKKEREACVRSKTIDRNVPTNQRKRKTKLHFQTKPRTQFWYKKSLSSYAVGRSSRNHQFQVLTFFYGFLLFQSSNYLFFFLFLFGRIRVSLLLSLIWILFRCLRLRNGNVDFFF